MSRQALHLGVLAYHLGLTLAFPYDLNYGEGYVLNDAVRLSRGESLYIDLQHFPMVRSPHPPLFPLVWSAFQPLTGPAFWPGRLLSVLSLVGIGALVGWNAWRVRCGIWPAVAAVGLVAASPFVYQWAGYARVDMLALLFAVGGVVTAQWIGGWRGVLVSAVLCGLALWTKQTTATAAVAVAIAYTLRSWRFGAAFALIIGLPSVVVAAVLNAATAGEFVHHVLAGNASNPVIPLRAAVYVAAFLILDLPAVVAAVWWLRRSLSGRPSPIAVYLPIVLLAAWSAGNGGSSVNYLIEPVLLDGAGTGRGSEHAVRLARAAARGRSGRTAAGCGAARLAGALAQLVWHHLPWRERARAHADCDRCGDRRAPGQPGSGGAW